MLKVAQRKAAEHQGPQDTFSGLYLPGPCPHCLVAVPQNHLLQAVPSHRHCSGAHLHEGPPHLALAQLMEQHLCG